MLTNFGKLSSEEILLWQYRVWRAARNVMFINNFSGDDSNAMIQRVTELKKTVKGTKAVITLVADMEGDGVVGDNQLEGNEEEAKSFDQTIRYDQMRNAHRLEGVMADMKSIVQFRKEARSNLSYWAADRVDQLAFLTLSGVSYAFKNNGAARLASQFPDLEFAADVTAPTANRHRRWDATNGLVAANTGDVDVADKPTWAMLVEAKAFAVDNYIRPVRTADGIDVYNVFMTPRGIAKLKQDADFLNAWRNARERGETNPLFKGTPHGGTNGFYIDGLNIMEYRHVFNTRGATSGSKWGSGGLVDGQRILFCGAQAMGLADLGLPTWKEKDFDYDNSPGISIAKIIGMKKPVFRSSVTGTNEDHGVLCIDTAI